MRYIGINMKDGRVGPLSEGGHWPFACTCTPHVLPAQEHIEDKLTIVLGLFGVAEQLV